MSKTTTAAKVAKLREQMLPTALRCVFPTGASHPLPSERILEIAEEAVKMAHAIAVAAVGIEDLLNREEAAIRNTKHRWDKDRKFGKRALSEMEATGPDATSILGGTP